MTTILPQDMPANKREWLALFAKLDANLLAIDAAWIPYTPVVEAGTGTLTSVTGKSGRYKQIGKTVHVFFEFTIAANGTGASWLVVTLPVACLSPAMGVACDDNVTGALSQVRALGGSVNTVILTYASLYPGGTGYHIIGNITYEAL